MPEIEMVPCSTTGCPNMAPARKAAFSGFCAACAEGKRLAMGWAPLPDPVEAEEARHA